MQGKKERGGKEKSENTDASGRGAWGVEVRRTRGTGQNGGGRGDVGASAYAKDGRRAGRENQ